MCLQFAQGSNLSPMSESTRRELLGEIRMGAGNCLKRSCECTCRCRCRFTEVFSSLLYLFCVAHFVFPVSESPRPYAALNIGASDS